MRQISTIWARGASALAIGTSLLFSVEGFAAPVSSAFTYQGELYDNGVPFVGSIDLRFTPYADASNPTLLGAPLVVEDVLVSNGVFTARVDFGPGFFVGDAVFLEVAVRPFDSTEPAAFEALAPRQEITATPYALKPSPGSVTDVELAGDAVGSPQIADDSIGSGDIADGSVMPQDLALAAGGFDTTFWRVGGNNGSTGVLGVLDAQGLGLVAPLGVSINGARFNGNTELTLRGNPDTPEANADLTLWPRGGEAFFNIASFTTPANAISTPSNTWLGISNVGTNPFTGFVPRAIMGFDGSLGIGGGDPMPHARLHVSRVDQGFDAPADATEAMELVLEDSDAQFGLYSSSGGAAGSVIGLAEMNAGAFVDQWGLYRGTTAAGSALQFSFGTNSAAAANPVLFRFGTNGSLGIGAAPFNVDTELHVAGAPGIPGGPADIALQPQGNSTLFNWSASGTSEATTVLNLQIAGPSFNYEPRVRFASNGAMGVGRFATLTQPDSFVFADDSVATTFGANAANQFMVRASGGTSLNGPVVQDNNELSVNGRAAGEAVELALRELGGTISYVQTVSGTSTANSTWRLLKRDGSLGPAFFSRLWIAANGFLGVNSGFSDPAFPFEVGTTTSNGNGAHVTTGGVWTNGSSRSFKEAFTAIDPQQILGRVLQLPITRWRYRGGEDAWHLGPVAEDFRAAFGLGGNDKYIGTVDADGVALAAIQGLHARSEARAAALAAENEALRGALDALARRVEALEHAE